MPSDHHRQPQYLVGIDVGGTFTDAVVLSSATGEALDAFKLPSTPSDPAQAVIQALHRIHEQYPLAGSLVCHGTTVGTNTLIQHQGEKTALIATEGFTDVIALRRQNRPSLYDLNIKVSPVLAESHLRFGAQERIDSQGNVLQALTGVDELVQKVKQSGAKAVAISLLHAYINPVHELAIAKALRAAIPDLFISVSSDVCPEFKEFERTSTTLVNAYIGPAVKRYIDRIALEAQTLGIEKLMIVKSNGGLSSPENAAKYPVHLIESGPAAGMIATVAYARSIKRPDVIAFDMGGTTAKAGVVQNHHAKIVDEFLADQLVDGRNVGGYPIRSTVLDIVEIGSGGGSIAWIDPGGVLKVGPDSAGADPGPACYSRGGDLPTVTDAHAVIGTLFSETFIGTGVAFNRDLAVEAIRRHIAEPMGWSVARAAHSILQIAVANMTEMVRLATVRRGLDPRQFSIVASGGAGPLHACEVGAQVGAREVIIPPLPGMFSALGATMGEVRHDLSQTMLSLVSDLDLAKLKQVCHMLVDKATQLMQHESVDQKQIRLERTADLRFAGQLFELSVPLGDASSPLPERQTIEKLFRQAYESEFGFDLPESKVQLVNVRLTVKASLGQEYRYPEVDAAQDPSSIQPYRYQDYLDPRDQMEKIPVFQSKDAIGLSLHGPMLIEHAGSTVWVGHEHLAQIHRDGSVQFSLTTLSEQNRNRERV